MLAKGFVQIIPERWPNGVARSLSIQRVTQKHPRDPMPGAIIVAVEIDVPDELAHVQTLDAAADAGMMTLVLEPVEG